MKSQIHKLESKQEKILESFIFTFFEPTRTKRKNSGNELDYISTTLDKIFKQNFGFNLNRRQIENAYKKLGYQIFYKNGIYNSETKKSSPKKNGEINLKISGFQSGIESPYTYFDIDPKIVRTLMRTISKLSETTNISKHYEVESMRKKILEFKNEIK